MSYNSDLQANNKEITQNNLNFTLNAMSVGKKIFE